MSGAYISNENKLRALLLDEKWPDALRPWMKGVNIFDPLRISRSENRHSNMLAWLFDPQGSHGLGSCCLEGLVKNLCRMTNGVRTATFLTADWNDAHVYREWGDGANRIDLLIEVAVAPNKSLVIALENKIDSTDSKGQLQRYREMVLKQWPEKYNKGQHLFVFLTPNGDDPSYAEANDDWIRLSYGNVVRVVETELANMPLCLKNVSILIQDYINLIRRDIMTDAKLIKLCNAIYRKHKEAFELIFRNADMDGCFRQAKEVIGKYLEVQDKTNGLIYTGSKDGTQSCLSFQTKAMNDILRPLDEGMRGSWNNQDVYYYWFDVDRRTNKIKLVVEFGPRVLSDNKDDPMRVMGQIINSKKNLDNGVYRRMKSYAVMDIPDDDLDERKLQQCVRAASGRLLKDEGKWIAEYKKICRDK